jgi:predicted Mrr-cat superfamily restriction endonuclease
METGKLMRALAIGDIVWVYNDTVRSLLMGRITSLYGSTYRPLCDIKCSNFSTINYPISGLVLAKDEEAMLWKLEN